MTPTEKVTKEDIHKWHGWRKNTRYMHSEENDEVLGELGLISQMKLIVSYKLLLIL